MRLITAFTLCAFATCSAATNADVTSSGIHKSHIPGISSSQSYNRPVRVAQDTATEPEEPVPIAAPIAEPIPDTTLPAPAAATQEAAPADTADAADAGQPCPKCGQIHQTQRVRSYQSAGSNNDNILQRAWNLEKRKNAWLRRTFFN